MMKNTYTIYIAKDTRTDKAVYVGSTKRFLDRMCNHRGDAFRNNSQLPLHKLMREGVIKFEKFCTAFSKESALLIEDMTTMSLNTQFPSGCNIVVGGRSNYWLGKKRDKETIKKMSETRIGVPNIKLSKPIVDSRGRIFVSIAEASRQLGIARPNICHVLSGKIKSAGGLTFKRVAT